MKTWRSVFFPAVLCGLVAAVFADALSYPLCPFDDALYLIPRSPLTDISQSIWMPLTYLSYALDRALGWGTAGMHAQSIVWHMACAALFYMLLLRLFKNHFAAFVAALVWAIHPLRVESVVWIASRKDVISTFFLLAALLAWIGDGTAGKRPAPVWSFVFLMLGATAKPSVMVFPLFTIAFDYCLTRQRHSIHCWISIIALSVAIALEGGLIQRVGATEFSSFIPLWYRLLNAVASLSIYVHHTLWPEGLAVQCVIRFPAPPRLSLVGLLIAACAVLWLARVAWSSVRVRSPDPIHPEHVGVALFFGSLVPFLGVAGFGYHAFADRYTIVPAFGLSLTLAALIDRWRQKRDLLPLALVIGASAALTVIAAVQTRYWRDTETLVGHTLAVDGDRNLAAHRALAIHAWQTDHDMEKVYHHFKAAYDSAWNEPIRDYILLLGNWLVDACYETGRSDEAKNYYYQMCKWNARHAPSGQKLPAYAAADILFDAHSETPECRERAYKNFAEFQSAFPGASLTHALGYRLAVLANDQMTARRFLELCVSEPEDRITNNREWAKLYLERMREGASAK